MNISPQEEHPFDWSQVRPCPQGKDIEKGLYEVREILREFAVVQKAIGTRLEKIEKKTEDLNVLKAQVSEMKKCIDGWKAFMWKIVGVAFLAGGGGSLFLSKAAEQLAK